MWCLSLLHHWAYQLLEHGPLWDHNVTVSWVLVGAAPLFVPSLRVLADVKPVSVLASRVPADVNPALASGIQSDASPVPVLVTRSRLMSYLFRCQGSRLPNVFKFPCQESCIPGSAVPPILWPPEFVPEPVYPETVQQQLLLVSTEPWQQFCALARLLQESSFSEQVTESLILGFLLSCFLWQPSSPGTSTFSGTSPLP